MCLCSMCVNEKSKRKREREREREEEEKEEETLTFEKPAAMTIIQPQPPSGGSK